MAETCHAKAYKTTPTRSARTDGSLGKQRQLRPIVRWKDLVLVDVKKPNFKN